MSRSALIDDRPRLLRRPDFDVRRGRRQQVIHTLHRATFQRARDRGALSLELAILFPLVLMLTFGAVQTGLWFEARSMCQAAAEAGVRAGKVLHAPTGAGASAARTYLADISNGLVVSPNVTETRTAATVDVTCAGQAQNVIPLPGLNIAVVQSSHAGIERFTQ